MQDFFYDQDGLVIAAVMLAALFLLIHAGRRLGERNCSLHDERFRHHISTLLGSVLGLMALMLGFTFSIALNRYDSRSDALIQEANAIGTSYLRAGLLPAATREEVKALLRRHVELRLEETRLSLDRVDERMALLNRSTAVLDEVWQRGLDSVAIDANPVTTGLFIQSLNDTIDAFGRREALVERHVPELVLILMFFTVLLTGAVLGYSCGVAGHAPSVISFGFGLLVVFVTYIIIDIDRPRRGLIQVDHAIMDSLARSMRAPATAGSAGPGGT